MNDRHKDQHYQVPRRFGLRTILVVTAVFGLMLSIVKWTDTSPVVLVFYASFVVVVGAAQVVFERSPRLGSILAGALFLPLLKFGAFLFDNGLESINSGPFTGLFSESQLFYMLVFGALYGYLSGTVLAGLYLVADKLRLAFPQRYKHRVPTEAS
jgi:hypothetical protein